MWSKHSFIPLAAAAVLALNSDQSLTNQIAASLFFPLGLMGRLSEEERKTVKEEEEYEPESVFETREVLSPLFKYL